MHAGYYEGDFFYVNWDIDLLQFKNYHINIKETMGVVLSVIRRGHLWTNKCCGIRRQYDNQMHN